MPDLPRLLTLCLVLLASCSGGPEPEKPSSLPFEDDFSNCAKGWSTDTDEFVSLSCTDGSYRFEIKNALKPQTARIFFSTGVKSLNVEADATRRAGPEAIKGDELLIFGVGCWASLVNGYLFVISPNGAWAILKVTPGASLPTPLAQSPTASAIPGLAETNRIGGICVGGGQQPTRLALNVNGQRIATAEDPDGFDSFPGFGFSVFSSESGTDVRFDNLVAREAGEAEVASSETGTEPPQEPSAKPIVDDDFSDPASGWSTDEDPGVALAYVQGSYRILVKKPSPQDSRLPLGSLDDPKTYGGLSVEADATERTGPKKSGPLASDPFEFHGVACWADEGASTDGTAYKFVLTPDGYYAIFKEVSTGGALQTLTEGQGSFGGFGATNRIRGDCLPTGDGSTSLVLYIDGRRVAEATDPDGLDRFSAIGLTVETSEGGTDVLFDNVVVREPKT
jgi:hypothetical protein